MMENYSSPEFEAAYTYTGTDLGTSWSPEAVFFRLWAPTAISVDVRIYSSGADSDTDLVLERSMTPDAQGTWVLRLPGNWNGYYYTYHVRHINSETEACDPYATAVGVNGKRAMILDLSSTEPYNWETDIGPHRGLPLTDAVIYEAHIRDHSMEPASGIREKGKYAGLTQRGTTLMSGIPTGLDHILGLGITHIQLQPVFDFGSVDESQPSSCQYNWGYDPVNFNVPEGSYSSDPMHGEVRIREFRQMVKDLHDSGLNVVMDVVYNHVYKANEFCFNKIVPGYFSRNESDGSGCGNDTASERLMVRKYIVDSVLNWVENYHIDGFRFDLAGLIDIETIRTVITTVNNHYPGIVFYGEGWNMDTVTNRQEVLLTNQDNARMIPEFSFFNDTFRDMLRGSVFSTKELGFLTGDSGTKDVLCSCFMGVPPWACSPAQSLNYISCHDNHTLWDRLKLALPKASDSEIARRCRLGGAFTLLSQGVPFLLAGEELLRSKPLEDGEYESNSYRSNDSVNSVKWSTLDTAEGIATRDYYRGLIALRKSRNCFRMQDRETVLSRVRPIPCSDKNILAFRLRSETERTIVVFNSGLNSAEFSLPDGTWNILVNGEKSGTDTIDIARDSIMVDPISAYVLVQPTESRVIDVVAARIWKGEKFLLCQRPESKARGLLWELPGGKTEPGETHSQALIRECREELGLDIDICGVFAQTEHAYPDITIRLTAFDCKADGQSPILSEHNAFAWISPPQIIGFDLCPADQKLFSLSIRNED